MSSITSFSSDLLLEILQYLDEAVWITIVAINRYVYEMMIRKIRYVSLNSYDRINADVFNRLNQFIDNPYRQLAFSPSSQSRCLRPGHPFLRLNSLKMAATEEELAALESLVQLENLDISINQRQRFYDEGSSDDDDSCNNDEADANVSGESDKSAEGEQPAQYDDENYDYDDNDEPVHYEHDEALAICIRDVLTRKVQNSENFGLESLTIREIQSFDGLTPLPGIEQIILISNSDDEYLPEILPMINIAKSLDLSVLRTLTLFRCHIEDVSSLDHIYDLTLEECRGVQDLTPLNHNHRIKIDRCDEVDHFSSCFKYSKFITVAIAHEHKVIYHQFLDYPNFKEVKSLHLTYRHDFQVRSFPPKLTSLTLIGLGNTTLTLPKNHQLKELQIINCYRLKYVNNLNNFKNTLKILHLNDLPHFQSQIMNIELFSFSFTSLLNNNKYLKYNKLLKNVKCEHLTLHYDKFFIADDPTLLASVQYLKIKAEAAYDLRQRLHVFQRLKVLHVEVYPFDFPVSNTKFIIRCMLQNEGNIEKFIFSGVEKSLIREFKEDWMDVKYIRTIRSGFFRNSVNVIMLKRVIK